VTPLSRAKELAQRIQAAPGRDLVAELTRLVLALPEPAPVRDVQEDEELALIDAAFVMAMDGLECDSDLDFRRRAFERIQDLYEPDRLMGQYRNRVDPIPSEPRS
jgi:hypothetical protein